jgi:nitrile hydratase subunit beta
MDGIHDLGGMHGFGPVVPEPDEPVFHADWERRVFGLTFSTGCTVDEFRHGIEQMDPAEYLNSSYYEHWLVTIEKNLLDKGRITAEELDARTRHFQEHPQAQPTRREDPQLARRFLEGIKIGNPSVRAPAVPPRFQVGDRVVARNTHPHGHTRLPRYVRGKRGTIHAHYGTHLTPDTNAHGLGEQPQPVYNVRFDARELWGDSAEERQVLHIDLWESYLEPA